MISIALVHPWMLVRDGIASLCAYMPDLSLIWHCAGHHEALERCRLTPPAVILVGEQSPISDVLFLLRRLKDQGVAAKMLVLGSSANHASIEEYLQLGASGYLDYRVDWDQLVVAIRRVEAGELLFPERVLQSAKKRAVSAGLSALTFREREVLRLLAQGENNQEIAETLFISEKTVKNHLTSLYKKLDVKDRTQAVIYLLQQES